MGNLSEYFSSSESKKSLRRIYIAYQIEAAILKEWQQGVGVMVGDTIITIKCSSPAQATVFNMRKQKLYALISHYTGNQKYQLRVRAS